MNNSTTNWLVLSGAIIVAGKWAKGESVSPKIVIAIVLLALMIGILGDVDEDIAQAFTILILVAVTLTYGTNILYKLTGYKTVVQGFGPAPVQGFGPRP